MESKRAVWVALVPVILAGYSFFGGGKAGEWLARLEQRGCGKSVCFCVALSYLQQGLQLGDLGRNAVGTALLSQVVS